MAHELYMQGMSYGKVDHWADQAACSGLAVELFEYQESDSPLAVGMTNRERKDFNKANFELAAEICIGCSVFFQCRDSATDEDRHWTVRGGEIPGRFESEAVDGNESRVCQNGHHLENGGRCPICKREANQRRKERLRLAK